MTEVSKEIIDSVFEAVETAKSNGKIRKGVNEVTKAIERGEAKLVVIAQDITPAEITMHLPFVRDQLNLQWLEHPPQFRNLTGLGHHKTPSLEARPNAVPASVAVQLDY